MAKNSLNLTAEIEALKEVYAAINRNDIAAIFPYFDPQIERIEPEGFPSSGTYRGHAEVKAQFSQARETWAEGSCDPERFIANGNKIVVFVHVRVRLKNRQDWIDARFADGFVFQDGKATQFLTFGERREALEWAGLDAAEYL